MEIEQKQAILSYVQANDPDGSVVRVIEPNAGFTGGRITYNPGGVLLHRAISQLTDEEYVRAYLLVRLVAELGYPAGPEHLELEKEYSIGRPSTKKGRVDVLLRYPADWPEEESRGRVFLFLECKAPEKFDADREYLKGQVFNLAKQEDPRPRYGVYYTTRSEDGELLDDAVIVDLDVFAGYEQWDDEGQPSLDLLPPRYGQPERVRFANIESARGNLRPLRTDVGAGELSRLQQELHDIVWGGGGTNNNDVFVMLVRLFLARVYDELETASGDQYRFQRGTATGGAPEAPEKVVERISDLFFEAAKNYLGYSDEELGETVPFERKKIAPAKVAYVVEQLQGLSLTRNDVQKDRDVLGDFFEGIVAQDFTQTKGQFFTPYNLVRFCLDLTNLGESATRTFRESRDEQGRPRLPNIIDPSAGSGTFLIEAMRTVTACLIGMDRTSFSRREAEFARIWFGEDSPNYWARDYIYGIEPNADLGLATKVNMILHGDGSTNVFVKSGLLAFSKYSQAGRSHSLAVSKQGAEHPYKRARNEEFDFLFTNPPFSLDLSDEEKKQLAQDFDLGATASSEAVFIERWYQLLREGGVAAAILPESVFDTSSTVQIRLWILKHFDVVAVVALPYVAFKPFTSTKTCVVALRKRSAEDAKRWQSAWSTAAENHDTAARDVRSKVASRRARGASVLLGRVVEDVESLDGPSLEALEEARGNADAWVLRQVSEALECPDVFMAEPEHVGYKRRKGLSDLSQPNDLFGSDQSVLESFRRGVGESEDGRFGFWVPMGAISARSSLRLDPKYHRLWTLRAGRVFPNYNGPVARLGDLIEPAERLKVAKGPLPEARPLIDLEHVEARTSRLLELSEVDEIGSDRVAFGQCDLAISKLEPYLGKVVRNQPEENSIGSPEWLLYNTREGVDIEYIQYLLLLPEMLEAYRCLQSGKRHARFVESDFLCLEIPRLEYSLQTELAAVARVCEADANQYQAKLEATRRRIDVAYESAIGGQGGR